MLSIISKLSVHPQEKKHMQNYQLQKGQFFKFPYHLCQQDFELVSNLLPFQYVVSRSMMGVMHEDGKEQILDLVSRATKCLRLSSPAQTCIVLFALHFCCLFALHFCCQSHCRSKTSSISISRLVLPFPEHCGL